MQSDLARRLVSPGPGAIPTQLLVSMPHFEPSHLSWMVRWLSKIMISDQGAEAF